MIDSDELVPPGRLRTMQIIAGALLMGVAIFLGIVLTIVQVQRGGQGLGPPQSQPILSLMALGTLAFMAVTSVVLPNNMVRQGLRRIARGEFQPPSAAAASPTADAEQILGLRQVTLIVSLALIEGPAFLGCIAYLLEGRLYVLGVVGLALALMLIRFPTEGSVRAWMRQQLDWLEQARQKNDAPDGF
jgi:hypothetical protein